MIAGLLAAFIAVGVGQLLAGIVAPDASPIVAVGEAAIDHTPPPVKNFALSAFGSNDKAGLVTALLPGLATFPPLLGGPALPTLWDGVVGLALVLAPRPASARTRPP